MSNIGIMIYIVTAELNEAEIFNPNTFAKQKVEKNINQYEKYIPFKEKIKLPTMTNDAAWIADKPNNTSNTKGNSHRFPSPIPIWLTRFRKKLFV